MSLETVFTKQVYLGLGDGRTLDVKTLFFKDGSKVHMSTERTMPWVEFTISKEKIFEILESVEYPKDEIPEYFY